jgi:glutaredoxin-related protein
VRIKTLIDSSPIFLFMKGTPQMPQCGFSANVVRILDSPEFKEIKKRLKSPVIFDGRNLYETKHVLSEGFEYFAIGKKIAK